MSRRALVIALVLAASCKKDPPKGGLPPATDWQSGSSAPAAAPPTTASNPHAGMDNPHAGVDNPHAGVDNPHAAGGGDSRGGVVPEPTNPRTLDKLADGRLGMGPFSLAPPAGWTTKPTTSNMRVANFVLPAQPGAEAELIIYYFGESGAGSVEDNLDRWLGQFQQPDGKSSRDAAKIEKTKFGGQDATYVSVTGRYVAQAMPGATQAVDKTDQALLGAIVSSPSGPYYFKLVGAKKTLDANAKAFRAMLDSLKIR